MGAEQSKPPAPVIKLERTSSDILFIEDTGKEWVKFTMESSDRVFPDNNVIRAHQYLSWIIKDLNNVKAALDDNIPDEDIRFAYYVQNGESLTMIPTIDENISDKGWVRRSRLGLIDVEFVEPTDKSDLGYTEYRREQGLPALENSLYIFSKREVSDANSDYIKIDTTGINKSYNNLVRLQEGKEYPFHLAHAARAESVGPIIQSGNLCIDSRCLDDVYDEKTGIFLGNHTEFRLDQLPGIYMELFQHTRIQPYHPPMTLDDIFRHFRYINVDDLANHVYGDVGFLFPFEKIFENYKVHLKADEKFGKGEDISLDQYIYSFGGECIVRANKIPIDLAEAMYIKFTFTEIDFILDSLSVDATFRDVIKLYLAAKSRWYVRKSALIRVLDAYGIRSMRSKNLGRLPPVFAVTPGKGFEVVDKSPSIYGDPVEDIESDWDDYDPNN